MLTQLHEKESAIRRLEEDKERISHENLQLRTRLELVADLHDQTKEEMGGQIKAVSDALEYERAEHASECHSVDAYNPPPASHQHQSVPLCASLYALRGVLIAVSSHQARSGSTHTPATSSSGRCTSTA